MFIGLSGGGQRSGLPREHEHMIGCPGLFTRRPGVKGNPYFPEAIMVNLSAEELRMGTDPTLPGGTAAQKLLQHVRAFKPRVLVAIKPQVSLALHGALPTAGIGKSIGHDEEHVEPATVSLEGATLPFITMPVHPNATGTGFVRFRDSKPRVAAAIAQALARS